MKIVARNPISHLNFALKQKSEESNAVKDS
jgi:hypothetical protein